MAARYRSARRQASPSASTTRWKVTSPTRAKVFHQRFDANSYLYITRAIDYFDFSTLGGTDLTHAFEKTSARFRFFSYSADWLYSPDRIETMTQAARTAGRDAIHHRIDAPLGHDAFLVLKEPQSELISNFLM